MMDACPRRHTMWNMRVYVCIRAYVSIYEMYTYKLSYTMIAILNSN